MNYNDLSKGYNGNLRRQMHGGWLKRTLILFMIGFVLVLFFLLVRPLFLEYRNRFMPTQSPEPAPQGQSLQLMSN